MCSRDVNKQTFEDHICLSILECCISTYLELVVQVEKKTDAWPIPVPAHPVTVVSGKQTSGIFTSMNISCKHRIKDELGGRTKYVGTINEIHRQQPQFLIVLVACYKTYLIFFSYTLLEFDTTQPLHDLLMFSEDFRYNT